MIQHNQRTVVEMLTDEQAGKLFKALFQYDMDNVRTNFENDAVLKIAYISFISDLDKGMKSKQKHSEINRVKGRMAHAKDADSMSALQKQMDYLKENDIDDYFAYYAEDEQSHGQPRSATADNGKRKIREDNHNVSEVKSMNKTSELTSQDNHTDMQTGFSGHALESTGNLPQIKHIYSKASEPPRDYEFADYAGELGINEDTARKEYKRIKADGFNYTLNGIQYDNYQDYINAWSESMMK